MITASICLSDIPADKIQLSEKNGKKYLNIVVDNRKDVDKYGNTHTVYVSQTKEERTAKVPKQYLGNGKEFIFQNQNQPQTNTPQASYGTPNEPDDLPW